MTLLQLLTALSNNTGASITLADSKGNKIITFNAEGYEAVEDDITSRTVSSIKLHSGQSITITIENPVGP